MGHCVSNDEHVKAFNAAREINLTLSYRKLNPLKSDKVSTVYKVEDLADREYQTLRSIYTYDKKDHPHHESRERTFYC